MNKNELKFGQYLISITGELSDIANDDAKLLDELLSYAALLIQGADYGNVTDLEKQANDEEFYRDNPRNNLIGRYLTNNYGEVELRLYGGQVIYAGLAGDESSWCSNC